MGPPTRCAGFARALPVPSLKSAQSGTTLYLSLDLGRAGDIVEGSRTYNLGTNSWNLNIVYFKVLEV